jgi:hypothetical protein
VRAAVLIVAVLITVCCGSAAAKTGLSYRGHAYEIWADPSSKTFAVRKTDQSIAIHRDDGSHATYSVGGCSVNAISASTLALDCLGHPRATEWMLLDVKTGATTPLAQPSERYDWGRILQIGSHWVIGMAGFNNCTDCYKADRERFALDWTTGRALDLGTTTTGTGDDFGPHKWLDSDAPGLGRPLCRPVERNTIGESGLYEKVAYDWVEQLGRWTVDWGEDWDTSGSGLVQRCGSGQRKRLDDMAISRTALAWANGQMIHVRDLRNGRTERFTSPLGDTYPGLALSTNRLLVLAHYPTQPVVSEPPRVYTAPLP